MADSKWNIASVKVDGQAMFGDNNQMRVDLTGLNVRDQTGVGAILTHFEQTIKAAPAQGQESLSLTERTELQQILRQLVDELRKPHELQSASFLRQCLDKVMEVAAAVPPLVKIALQLKTVLGF